MNGKQLKNSILQWAIQGKLVPQDPNDEPASILLEKIRAEKARLVKEKIIKKDKNESIIYRGDDNSYYEKMVATGEIKCIDDEIPFEIPQGWEWCRLGEICKFLSRGKSPSYSDVPNQYPVFAQKCNLKNGGISLEQARFLNPNTIDKWPDIFKLKTDDVLVNSTGTGTVCRTRLFHENYLGSYPFTVPDSHVSIIRSFEEINSTFLYSLLNSKFIQDYWNDNLAGSTNQKELYIGTIQKTPIPLPPLAEQHRIVSKIKELMPLADEYGKSEEELKALNALLPEALKKSILQEAIQGKLVPQRAEEGTAEELLAEIRKEKERLVKEGKLKKSALTDSVIYKGDDNKYYEQIAGEVIDITEDIIFEIPDSWEWCRLSSLCSIFTGATFKKDDTNTVGNGVRVLRGGNITPFKLLYKPDDIYLSKNLVKEAILLQKDDIVTPAVNSLENIGKAARVESDLADVTVGGFVFIIRPFAKNEDLSKYMLSLLGAPMIADYIRSITNKSGQAFYNIGKERLLKTLVPLPPQSEIQRIVEHIRVLFEMLK